MTYIPYDYTVEMRIIFKGLDLIECRGQQRMRCWMASPTWWTWVWVNSGNWWWTGRPGVLQFMVLQRVGHDWATELNWTDWLCALRSIKLVINSLNKYCFLGKKRILFFCRFGPSPYQYLIYYSVSFLAYFRPNCCMRMYLKDHSTGKKRKLKK